MEGMENAFMEGIGNVIYKLRERAGIYQDDLCEGICAGSTLSRLEWEGCNTGTWLIDAFLQRLGKSQDNFWTIVHKDDFQIMEYRRLIWDNLVREQYEEAGKRITEYGKTVQFNKNLHRQFQMRAQAFIHGKGEGDWEKAEALLRKAISLTVAGYEETRTAEYLLGREELEVLLLLAEAEAESGKPEAAEKLVKELLENIEKREWDEEELVKIYPKVLSAQVGFLEKKGKYSQVKFYAQKAVDLLAGNGVIYLLAEFLELVCWSMEQEREEEQREFSTEEERLYNERKKQAEALKDIWKEYGEFAEEMMRYCTNTQKEISLSSEIIQKCRKLNGLTQRELAENVCTPECLSRIENGKCSPQERKYRALMEKMDWAQDRNLYFINAKEYELHEQLRGVNRYLSQMEYEKAAIEWEKIKGKIPKDTLNNQQCILRHDTVLAFATGKISFEAAMERYHQALELTIPDWKNVNLAEWPLSRNEVFLISNLLEVYRDRESFKEIVGLKRKLKESMENTRLCEVYYFVGYSMVLYNLSMTEAVLGNIQVAYEIMQKGMKCSIRNGRCNVIPYYLYALAWMMNEDNFKENQKRTWEILEKAICLCDLFRMPNLKQHILEYQKECWESTKNDRS